MSIELNKNSALLTLPEQLYGTIKRVGILNNEPILYGDVNLLKVNDLFYISGAKQVYRYVGYKQRTNTPGGSTPINPKNLISPKEGDIIDKPLITKIYLFTSIESYSDTEELTIPELERGTIRNAGYLFNEIIYSGDPNLVENGNLFYHDTLPYISVVSNVDGVINLSTKELNEGGEITTVITEYMVYTPHNYSKDYLTFEALEDGTFTLNIPAGIDSNYMTSVSYSTDSGETWNTTTIDNTAQTITTPTINAGDKVLWKGVGKQMASSSSNCSQFSSMGNFSVSGNIMSLLYGDKFTDKVNFANSSEYNFALLFSPSSKITSADKLILPATTLTRSCYMAMFYSCTSLTTAPELPATIMKEGCYGAMFRDCVSLIIAPELPAITLAKNCYGNMFNGCSVLLEAPALPATTLANGCYNTMFSGCTSLTSAPVLRALILVNNCYAFMFKDCSSLNNIKALFTTTPSTVYTMNWVDGVSLTGTFVKNVNATWTNVFDATFIPTGWTVETASS